MQPTARAGGPIVTPLHLKKVNQETIGERKLREETGIDKRDKSPSAGPLTGGERPPPEMAPVAAKRKAAFAEQARAPVEPAPTKEPVRAEKLESRVSGPGGPDQNARADARFADLRNDNARARQFDGEEIARADTRQAQRDTKAEPFERVSTEPAAAPTQAAPAEMPKKVAPAPVTQAPVAAVATSAPEATPQPAAPEPAPTAPTQPRETPEDTTARQQFDATVTEVRVAEQTAAQPPAEELDTVM